MKHRALQSLSDFVGFLNEQAVYITKYDKEKLHGRGRWRGSRNKDDVKHDVKDVLFVEWTSGGMTGGSCWHSEGATIAVDSEPEPELEYLDKAILAIYPNIPYLQYKKIEKLIQRGERTQSEYYGNYYEYSYKFIEIKDLYEFLVSVVPNE